MSVCDGKGSIRCVGKIFIFTFAGNKSDSLAVMGRVALVLQYICITWKVPSHSSFITQKKLKSVCKGLLWN